LDERLARLERATEAAEPTAAEAAVALGALRSAGG